MSDEVNNIEIPNPLSSGLPVRPFAFIRRTHPANLLNFIQQEHPQTIALILAYLEPNKASIIIQNLPHEIQSDVARRIATMNRVNPEFLREIERVLEKKLSTLSNEDYTTAGGVESIVEILNLVDRASEKQIIEALEDEDPELAEEIKKRMFVFEDIIMLDDRAIQKVMREVDSQELAKALFTTDSEVQNKIFKNMSRRAAVMLKEDAEYMGPIRMKDVDEAQQKIVSIIRHLEDCGEIAIARTGEDEIVSYDKNESPDEIFRWDDIDSFSKSDMDRIVARLDFVTLAIALKLSCRSIVNKFKNSLSFGQRLYLKVVGWKLKNISIDDVMAERNKIMSIFSYLHNHVKPLDADISIKIVDDKTGEDSDD